MRTLCISISILGAALVAYSFVQIIHLREYRSRVRAVQEYIVKLEVFELSKRTPPPHMTGFQSMGSWLDGIERFEKAWTVAACLGMLVALAGARGIFLFRKVKVKLSVL